MRTHEHHQTPDIELNEHGELIRLRAPCVTIEPFTFDRSNPIIVHDLPGMIDDRYGAPKGLKDPEFRGVVLMPTDPDSGKVAAVVKQVGMGTFVGVQLSGSIHGGHAPVEGSEQLFEPGKVIPGTKAGTHTGLVIVADKLDSGIEALQSVPGAERLVDIASASAEHLNRLAAQSRVRRIGRFFRR